MQHAIQLFSKILGMCQVIHAKLNFFAFRFFSSIVSRYSACELFKTLHLDTKLNKKLKFHFLQTTPKQLLSSNRKAKSFETPFTKRKIIDIDFALKIYGKIRQEVH